MKLTKAQQSLVLVVKQLGPCFSGAHLHYAPWLREHFNRAKRAGLIQSAGYEVTIKADDFLNSTAGRTALSEAEGGK